MPALAGIFFFYGLNGVATIWLRLRRTLVRSVSLLNNWQPTLASSTCLLFPQSLPCHPEVRGICGL
jgi:hypothetical protein